jgi:hypothetical protein
MPLLVTQGGGWARKALINAFAATVTVSLPPPLPTVPCDVVCSLQVDMASSTLVKELDLGMAYSTLVMSSSQNMLFAGAGGRLVDRLLAPLC